MVGTKPINILLADAAFLVREGIKSVISGKPYLQIQGEAADSYELRKLLTHRIPDIIIIDYNAPGAFSLDDIRYVVDTAITAKILVISSDLKKEEVLKALEYGTKGFLLKACDQTEILGAIHAVAKNEKFFCSKVVDFIMERHSPQERGPREACEPTCLTQREIEIVKLMAEGKPAQEIADKLSLSVHTIYTHRKNIKQKLGLTTAAEVILYAINTSLLKA